MANMFALILVIATLVTGILWCVDKFIFAPKRRERQAAAQAAAGDSLDNATLKKVSPKPGWLETGASVFPVLAIVLVVRSFIYEPFQIPSGSMMPTLLIGDFILVEKFAYGIKDPIYQKTLIETAIRNAVMSWCLNTRRIRAWTTSNALSFTGRQSDVRSSGERGHDPARMPLRSGVSKRIAGHVL